MEVSQFIASVEALHADARRRGLFFQYCEDESVRGRHLHINGAPLISFASCSYLGLETHPALVGGAIDAVRRYGTQFSVSRGYLSIPLYATLEEKLGEIFGAHALVTSSTTLGHQAAFDALMTEKDAIVLDHQVHASVHRAATLARASGTKVEMVHHEDLGRAVEVVQKLRRERRTVWFATDGVTSMYGDVAPIALLQELLDLGDNVRLYIDDAHGMSWAGEHGRGSFLSRMALDPRMVIATSLNKAFSAGGGALVFPRREERERVRMCGGPMTFSGPVQPPMLGAAVASADVHLSREITDRQDKLASIIAHANARLLEAGLPLLTANETPIKFIRCGLPRVSNEVAQRVAAAGVYVNVSMYPSVPMRRSGIRVSLTAAHTRADVDRAVDALAGCFHEVLDQEGIDAEELDRLFEKSVVADLGKGRPSRPPRARRTPASGQRLKLELEVQRASTIESLDAEEWDEMLGRAGCTSAASLRDVEAVFRADREPEHRWRFDYVVVRDVGGKPLAATVFTTLLQKDDMYMRAAVSERLEARREADPYYLTSLITMTGTGLSEGDHLYLDRASPRWKEALRVLLAEGARVQRDANATALVIRDLIGEDPELEEAMLREGFAMVPGLDSHVVDVDWADDDDLVRRLPSSRYRRASKRSLQRKAMYEVRELTPEAPGLDFACARLHRLYLEIAERKVRLNTFYLPPDLVKQLVHSEAWEVMTLHLDAAEGGPSDGSPVAFWAAHRSGGHYAPLFGGLDYRYVGSHGSYKQLLFQVLRRARALGMERVHLGMDADLEKRRWGSRPRTTCMYVQADDSYRASLLREAAAEVGLG